MRIDSQNRRDLIYRRHKSTLVPALGAGPDLAPSPLRNGHDAIRQDRSGKRRMQGKLYVRECNADGSPRDPNHPWFKTAPSDADQNGLPTDVVGLEKVK